jgi:antitoxin (DNA-binding transcriptional repressor) of toxin-antitoxin stability system
VQVVNIKELKSRLSAYLREVARGETFWVTDRNQVVAQLGPVSVARVGPEEVLPALIALGARPPLRARRPSDYGRPGSGSGLATSQIDALLEESRGERTVP